MNGKLMLYMSQNGHKIYASTVKELCEKAGGSKAQRMFQSVKGKPHERVHIGYVIRGEWFRAFTPYQGKA